jgi:hypothetical protein
VRSREGALVTHKLYVHLFCSSHSDGDMKGHWHVSDASVKLLWVWRSVFLRDSQLDVLDHEHSEEKELGLGQNLAHARAFSDSERNKVIPNLGGHKSLGIENFWTLPIVGVHVDGMNVIEYNGTF